MAYQDVFKRVEKKYLIDEEKYNQLFDRIRDYITPDKYGESTICNIYYDTPDHRLIRRSLEKPVYKEKFRIRSYGVPTKQSEVFVELKKKFKGVVYKRRAGMTLEQIDGFVNENKLFGNHQQIEKEIQYFLHFYREVAPAMYLSYDRTAYYVTDNPELRITFDTNITYREEELSLDKGVWGTKLLNKGERVLEIKIPGAMPVWLADILADLKIYPTSFSKYGRAYLQTVNNNFKKEKVNDCA